VLDPEAEVATSIIGLMVLSAAADGVVAGVEAMAIHQQVMAIPLLQKGTHGPQATAATRARLAEVGLDRAVRELAHKVRERSHRELALRCCGRVVSADGKLVAEEARVLGLLREAFLINPEELRRMLVGR
jgi:cysteine sulfinate desulfinase/cysteine desulfurase-like protein